MGIKRLSALVGVGLLIGGGAFAAIWYFGRTDEPRPDNPANKPQLPALPAVSAALLDAPAPEAPGKLAFFDPAKTEVKELARLKAGEGGEQLEFTPDGSYLVSAGYGDSAVKVWDWRSGEQVARRAHRHRINDMVVAPQGDGVWTVDAYQHLCFWPFDGKVLGQASEIGKEIGSNPYVAVSPNGVLVATTSFDKKLTLWNAKSRSQLGDITSPYPLRRAAFSPDGKRLIVATNTNQLMEYTLATGHGRWLHILPVKPEIDCTSVTFSPDGKRFSTGHTQPWVTVWDGVGMNYQRWLKFPEQAPTAVTYTRDSRWAAIAVNRNGIYLWDPDVHKETGAALNLKPGHDFVHDLAFSPDGRILASVDDSGTIVLWSSP